MPIIRMPIFALLIASLLALPLAPKPASSADLIIGAGPDSRQQILTELASLLLEAENISSTIKHGMELSELLPMLKQKEIDLFFQLLPENSPETTGKDIARLPSFSFSAGPVALMRASQAKELQIETVSRLAEIIKTGQAKLKLDNVDQAEAGRLKAAYGLTFPVRSPLAMALPYRSLKTGRIDVAIGHADDGRIVAFRLTAIADDLNALPTLKPTPLVHKEALKQMPAIAKILSRLNKHLDAETMRRLHGAVIIAHRDPRSVAKEWLQQIKLLKP